MATARDLQRRIRSVKNIAQITKAMEVVSMNKMRRSQQFALAARPYALASIDMLKNILKLSKKIDLPSLLKERTITRAVIVVVTTDRGLVGGFNDSVIDHAEARKRMLEEGNIKVDIISIGKKAKEYFERNHQKPHAHFEEHADHATFADTKVIAQTIIDGYKNKVWDAVYIDYTHFKTTLRQEPLERRLLPTSEPALEDIIEEIIPEYGRFSELKQQHHEHRAHYNYSYIFEPSAEYLLEDLITNLLHTAIHHILLESNASEHSARMVAMKHASDNADDLKDRLTLQFNKVRQAGITAEISEIVAGAEALE